MLGPRSMMEPRCMNRKTPGNAMQVKYKFGLELVWDSEADGKKPKTAFIGHHAIFLQAEDKKARHSLQILEAAQKSSFVNIKAQYYPGGEPPWLVISKYLQCEPQNSIQFPVFVPLLPGLWKIQFTTFMSIEYPSIPPKIHQEKWRHVFNEHVEEPPRCCYKLFKQLREPEQGLSDERGLVLPSRWVDPETLGHEILSEGRPLTPRLASSCFFF